MESVYKICVLGKDSTVKEIVVFSRESKEEQTESPFSPEERAFIESENIPVKYVQHAIYKDDSISTIKYKILAQLENPISYHELYLFSHIRKNRIRSVLENTKGSLNVEDYKQLLVNLNLTSRDLREIDVKKTAYTQEDMTELSDVLHDESIFYKISIGKRFRSTHNELFSANPFDMLPPKDSTKDICWTQSSMNPLESFENQLLLNNASAKFIDNTIFACFAADVLEYCSDSGINQEWATSVYFPLLIKEEIANKDALEIKRKKLLATTKKMTPKPDEQIELLYDIYRERKGELSYSERGVTVFSIRLHPDFKHILPLDVVFKNVHATKSIPFIKYNPGPRRENIYRLYSETVTKYGTKIPFLPARTIIKLSKETGKNKQISFSVEHPKGDFYLQIYSNGDISISGNNFRDPLSLDVVESVLKEIANPVIDHMNDFLKKNGYVLNRFESLRDSTVEIEYIQYILKMRLQKEIDLAKCANSVFDITETDIYKGAKTTYKRVENYSPMNEEDAFIAGLFGHPREEIVDLIAEKYEMEKQQAALRLVQFLRDHEQQEGHFVKTSVRIAESPGFPVSMNVETYEDSFVCEISLDNSIAQITLEYIDAFSIYMDSILRLSQDPKSTGITTKKITAVCSKKSAPKEVQKFDNILTGIEASILYDTIEEFEEEGEGEEQNLKEFGAFGDLEEYEDAAVDIDTIQEYEELPEFQEIESLSPPSLVEESVIPNEPEESLIREGTIESIPEESEDSSSINSFMYAPEEEEEELKGGSKNKLDGMVLKDSNNNIFLSKLKKREPTLFLSEDQGRFSAYSKICPAAVHRQPVILTPDEMARIKAEDDKNGSKSYNHALEYGTDPENKNFYICPRYWCLKTNSPISDKDAKEGKKCGKILPKGSNIVKPGHYIVEFNHPRQHLTKDGEYLENTPGFIEGKLHPKGLCMPCCFKKSWDSSEQSKRRIKCNSGETDIEDTRTAKQETYIYDIRRYPIPQQRWGFLPISVQYFLQTDNSLAIDPNNTKYLRDDKTTTTLLRFGVENSAKKSFVACIADLYAYRTQAAQVPTVENMCSIIASAVSIDLFLKYHNGSLASIFKPKTYDYESVDVTLYESSIFIRSLDQGNESHLDFIYDTIAAYENFKVFMTNPESYIDHTYLWDIVCSPNPLLFANGCNLAILRIREVDMTDDIELLCPTSVYSAVLFDVRKETIILIQHDEYFEPVYLFQSKIEPGEQRSITIQKTFTENRSPIKDVLQLIRNSIQKFCPPKSSMPNVYKFERSLPAESLRLLLLEYKLPIDAQVLNYSGKVVGFRLKYYQGGIFLPCYPSPRLEELPVLFMDDPTLFLNYRETIEGLQKIYERSGGKIRCRPVFKIAEDGQIVGLITETNQFIMLSDPAEAIEDEIPLLKDENFVIADKVFAQSRDEDPVRKETIRKIALETQFYGAFRTTVRILLNENPTYKQQIQKIVESRMTDSRDTIETLLHTMCDPFVSFKEFDDDTLASLGEISDCFLNPEDKKFCAITNGKAQIILPEYHLVSGRSNSLLYFTRVADELWRYKRIQLFMMNSKMYLNLTNTEYKINPDEMLMLESLLTQDYFKSLEPYQHGDTLITYETANPIMTQKYSSEISLQQQRELVTKDTAQGDLEDQLGIECIYNTHPITGKKSTSEWKTFFSQKATESDLHKTVKCSYYPIIYVYYEVNRTFLTVEQIKSKLIAEYAKHSANLMKVLAVLRKQGKRDMIDDIYKGKYTLETAIMSEVYFLTPLDLWVLAAGLQLPIILFHQKKLKNLIESANWLRLSEGKKIAYYFVRVPTEPDSPSNYLPQYSIVKPSVQATAPELLTLFANATIGSMISLYDYFDKIRFGPN